MNDPSDRDAESPPLRGTAVRGARLALVGFVLSRGVLLGVYVVLARLISPAEFGRYAAASIITGIGSLFSESGMASALIRRRDRLEEAANTAFLSLLISGLLLTAAALAIAPLVGLFFGSGRIGLLSAALSVALLLQALSVVPDALLQRRFSFLRRVAIDPLSALAFATAAIVAAVDGAGAWALVAGAYAAQIVSVVAAWSFAGFRPRRRLASVAVWRELAGFARPVLGSEVLSRVAFQLDAILLGHFKGASVLGQYRNGLRIAQQPSDAFVSVGAYVLLPTFVRISDHPERLRVAVQQILGLIATVALPVSIMLIPLGEPVAVLLLGPRWGQAGHAIAGLCGFVIGTALVSAVSEIYKAVERPQLLIRLHTVSLLTVALFVGLAAVPFGLIGVAVAVSVSRCVTAGYGLRLAAPLAGMRLRELGREATAPVAATAVMLVAMLAFAAYAPPLAHGQATAIALTVAEAVIGAVVYVAGLLTLDPGRRRSAARLVTGAFAGLRGQP
jgi:O-antigen/teichoic acid export membrane protein